MHLNVVYLSPPLGMAICFNVVKLLFRVGDFGLECGVVGDGGDDGT